MRDRILSPVIKFLAILAVSVFVSGCSAVHLDKDHGTLVNNSKQGTIGGKYTINSGDYATALTKAIQFYDANKCGTGVTANNTQSWRTGNCHTGDTVANGYHDAGDHVKFGLPASYAFAILGWSVYEFSGGFSSSDKTKIVTDILKRFSDYFMSSYSKSGHTFIYDVGDGPADHSYWGAPESQSGSRTSWQNTYSQGYADIGGLVAAGLALQALNYQSIDANYAAQCLDYATNLYFDIKGNQKYYIPNSKGFYGCNTDQVGQTLQDGGGAKSIWDTIELPDKLAMAAAFLYYADTARKSTYYTDLKNFLAGNNRGGGAKNQDGWVMSWNDLYPGAFVKAYDVANSENDSSYKSTFLTAINWNMNYWKNSVPTSSGGMKVISGWGNLRYNAAFAMLALKKIDIEADSTLQTLAKQQVDYIMGNNPRNGSYIIGFGSNWPQSPHHRGANPTQSSTAINTITGMLVGGPSANNDSYTDSWSTYAMAEGGVDYNAGLVGALAAMVIKYGGGGGGSSSASSAQASSSASFNSGSYYKFINRNSGKALDVTNGSTADGAAVIQWTYNGGNNQQWQIIDVGSGYYKIINRNSGKSADVSGGSTADGAAVIQWPYGGGNNQQWQILEVTASSSSSTSSAPANYVQNSGFESGSLSPWYAWNNAVVVNYEQYYGSYAVKCQANSSVEQVVTGLSPNTTYTLSGYIKSSDGGSWEYLGVKNYGGSDTYQGTVGTTYVYKSFTFTTGSTNTTATVYIYQGTGTGFGYGDGITIQ